MTQRYTAVAITLHWIIAIMLVMLIVVGWQAGDLLEALQTGQETDATLEDVRFVYNMHKTFGMLVLVLSLARLIWRLTHKTPPMPETMKGWEQFAARFTHIAFYVLMIGMPLLGWITASSSGLPSYLLDNSALRLPDLPVPQTDAVHDFFGWLHGRGGWAILVLLALHAGAALKHHFFDKDDVLSRMLPFLRRS
tara:strand:+ start:213 stop:794 length:582 start_codon:yes stop_codon:yes gene_type:complete